MIESKTLRFAKTTASTGCLALSMLSSACSSAPVETTGVTVDPLVSPKPPVSACNSTARLVDQGQGSMLNPTTLVPVYWGNKVNPDTVAKIPNFYQVLVSSMYLKWLQSEYSAPQVLAGAPVVIQPGNTSTIINEAEIRNELSLQIQRGVLHDGEQQLFIVHFPPGITVKDQSGNNMCSAACAYHSSYRASTIINYAVVPDCVRTCEGGGWAGESMAESHEIVEAITDRNGRGWRDPNQPKACGAEIGDICNALPATITTSAGTATVQEQWSNVLNACVVEDFAVPPGPVAGAGIGAIEEAAGQVQMVEVSTDGSVNLAYNVLDLWDRFVPLRGAGFAPSGAPVSMAYQTDGDNVLAIDAFVAGNNGKVDVLFEPGTGGSWQEADLPAPPAGVAPGAHVTTATQGGTQLDIFYPDTNGQVWVQWSAAGNPWSLPAAISGPGASWAGGKIAAVELNDGVLYAFWIHPLARGRGTLWMNQVSNGGNWGVPRQVSAMGFATRGPLAAIAQKVDAENTEQVDVFTADYPAGNLYETGVTSTATFGPFAIGGRVGFPPALGSGDLLPFLQLPGELDIAYVNFQGALQIQYVQNGTTNPWSAPIALSGPGFAPPGAPLAGAVFSPNQFDLFVAGNARGLPGSVYVSSVVDLDPWSPLTAIFPTLFPDGN